MIQQEIYAEMCEVYPQDLQLLKIFVLVGGLEHEFYFSIYWELGISSSQLTNSIIFQRGLNHQPVLHLFPVAGDELPQVVDTRPTYVVNVAKGDANGQEIRVLGWYVGLSKKSY